MKCVAVSDTHNHRPEIPEADVLFHAGDLTMMGEEHELALVAGWFTTLLEEETVKHICFVSGNHDWKFQNDPEKARSLFNRHPGIHYLQDSGIEIDDVKIYGSPWQPTFYDWAFNADRGHSIRKYWNLIPDNTDVLITHGPPYGYCDWVPRGEHVGCEELSLALDRVEPALHVAGHIHCSRNFTKHINGKTFIVNAAICNEKYRPIQKPYMIEFDNLEKKVISITD